MDNIPEMAHYKAIKIAAGINYFSEGKLNKSNVVKLTFSTSTSSVSAHSEDS
jgi:hypothetical protein